MCGIVGFAGWSPALPHLVSGLARLEYRGYDSAGVAVIDGGGLFVALINEYMPVVCICTRTRDEVYEKMLSNMREVEARHGRIIALVTDGDEASFPMAEDVIPVPEVADEWTPIVVVVGLQLLAYYAARARGTDIDKPRNLAKSVTVE